MSRTSAFVKDAPDLLRLTESLAGVGYWRFDLAANRLEWSEQVFRIHGMDSVAGEPNPQQNAENYVEEDRPKLVALFAKAREGEGFEAKLRLRRPDGEERIVVSKATVERDAAGVPAVICGVFMDVTEQDRAMAQLARSEFQFRMMAEAARDVIASYDPKGCFTYLSPSSLAVFGYTPDELIGRNPYVLMGPEQYREVSLTLQAYVQAGPNAPSPRIEYVARRKDGRSVDIECRPHSLWSPEGELIGFQDVGRDVTAAKRAQAEAAAAAERAERAGQAIIASEALYRLIADHATDLILRFGPDGLITYCSPSVRLWGFEPGEVEGRNMRSFLHPDDRPAQDQMIAALFSGVAPDLSVDRSLRAMLKDGSHIWLEGAPSIVRDADGKPVEVVSVFRDVTVRRQMQAELIAARDRAEAAAEAKAEFLANMSHELRTPLTAVLGFSQLAAAQPELTAETRRHLARVSHAGKALLSTVNDVLDLSKLEAGRLEIMPRTVDVAELARDTLDLFSADACGRALVLAAEGLEALPKALEVDPDRLRQVLLNLLGNAMKFTPAGRVTLAARYDIEESLLGFRVTDTGCGVPEDRLDSLFQRFNQVEGSVARRHGGTGLGLAICKRLVEAMGGEVSVESRLGAGSTFGFTLLAPGVCEIFAPVEADDDAPSALAGARILAVDDNAANRELIGAVLRPLGCAVTVAESGAAALALSASDSFDAILLDLRMPEMDGFETARRLRAGDGPNMRTPVLAFSADALADLSDDFDGLVAKPLTLPSLYASLSSALQPEAREAAIRRRAARG